MAAITYVFCVVVLYVYCLHSTIASAVLDCSNPNERLDPCPPLCPTDDCSQATPDGKCPPLGQIPIVLKCTPACRCIEGYWRKDGVCVPYAECCREDSHNIQKRSPSPAEEDEDTVDPEVAVEDSVKKTDYIYTQTNHD